MKKTTHLGSILLGHLKVKADFSVMCMLLSTKCDLRYTGMLRMYTAHTPLKMACPHLLVPIIPPDESDSFVQDKHPSSSVMNLVKYRNISWE
jgi:hypothetical protein